MSFKSAASILRYQDPRAAINWLTEALGLKENFVAEDGGAIVHAEMKAGDHLIFLGPDQADDKYGMHSPKNLNGTNQCVYLMIEGDVDDHAKHAEAAGALIVSPPWDTPYGAREYSCKDPEGHVWSIGTYQGA